MSAQRCNALAFQGLELPVKKVRYLAGALGAAPALAGLTPFGVAVNHQTGTGETHNAALAPREPLAACTGHTGNHTTHSGTTVRFYSAAVGSKTCIGTIQVSHTNASDIGGVVRTVNGGFCSDIYGGAKVNWPCKETFTRNGLQVSGYLVFGEGTAAKAYSDYPFKHNGF